MPCCKLFYLIISEAWREMKWFMWLRVKFGVENLPHLGFFSTLEKKNQPLPLQNVLLFTIFVYSFLVFLRLAIMVCQLLQSFTVLLPHFASVQFHFVFKAFHLCVQIHQSHCSVPSWGCILSSYICTVMFEFPCLLTLFI